MNNKIKILGIILTIAGAGISVALSFVNDKMLDKKIDEKVSNMLEKF